MEDKAKQRILKIQRSQELLQEAASNLDRKLYQAVLEKIEAITEDPAEIDRIFSAFKQTEHAKVLKQFASGIMAIGSMNADYFADVAANLDQKDYAGFKKQVNSTIQNRFGIDANGKPKEGYYIDSFINDTSIPRSVREYGYKAQAAGLGYDEVKAGFRDLILGEKGESGLYKKYYRTYAFDTFQQVDAAVQEAYSEKLGLKALMYLGGLMDTSREFCEAKNGKVFLKEEVADWKDDKFQGKPKNYNPFLDRGGYNCRHHLNYITDQMAVQRRSDLVIDDSGKLAKKGQTAAKAAPEEPKKATEAKKEQQATGGFKPAKNIKEVRALNEGILNKLGFELERITLSKDLELDQLNTLAENFHNLAETYDVSFWSTDHKPKVVYKSGNGYYGRISHTTDGKKLYEINFGDKYSNERAYDKYDKILGKSRVDADKLPIATQTHEFAHVMSVTEHSFRWANPKPEAVSFWGEMNKLKTAYHEELKAASEKEDKTEYFSLSLGKYASTNSNEFMAEAFTEYKLSSKPTKYAKLAGELIDKYFKKEK